MIRRFALPCLVLTLAAGLACAPVHADEKHGEKPGRIRVIGHAEEDRTPDFASVEIGVDTKGATPAAALDAASTAATGLVNTAKSLGVPEADIGTSSLSLAPSAKTIRQPDGSVREQPDGYRASNQVQIRLADMAKLGDLMRSALDSGANRINGISFGLRDPGAAQASVQVGAMKDARAQAERLAEAAGAKLGPVLSINAPPRSEAVAAEPPPYAMRAAAPGRKRVPVAAGTITNSASVEAVFAIAP